MRLNIYHFSIFFLILILFYPLIYYFSEKKISNKNNSLITYKYENKGFLSIKNFENLFESSNLKIKEINDKYFQNENDQVIYFYPSNKISIYNEINERNGEYSDLSTKENDIDLVKINDEIILIFNKKIIMFLSMFEISEELKMYFKDNNFFQNKSLRPECLAIEQKFKDFRRVNIALYKFNLFINQKNPNIDELDNKEKILTTYKTCFKNRLDQITTELNNFISVYFELQKGSFKNNLKRFVSENKQLFQDNNSILKFEKEIDIFMDELILKIKSINFEFNLISTPKILKKKQFQRNFNIYVISFILSFLISLIITYILFFLKNNVRLLKKIF